MNGEVKSLTLSQQQIDQIIERYVNEEILRRPHRVVHIDPWGYDENDDVQFVIGLEPMVETPTAAMIAGVAVLTAEDWKVLRPLPVYSNGTNGTNDDSNGGQAAEKEVAAIPSSDGRKRRTVSANERERIIGLVNAGAKRKAIAEAVGLTESQLYAVLAELRATGQLPHRAESAVA
jgi:hypothetical protein